MDGDVSMGESGLLLETFVPETLEVVIELEGFSEVMVADPSKVGLQNFFCSYTLSYLWLYVCR